MIRLRRGWRGLQAAWSGLGGNTRGAVWMLLSATSFAGMAASVKFLGQDMDPWEVTFFRCLFGLFAVLPFTLRLTRAQILTPRWPLHLVRAVLGYISMFLGYYALTHLPLADATALSFAKPLFLLVLAVLFLGESVRWRRWTATLVGFAGILVMVRPFQGALDPAMLVALLAALSVAIVSVLVKRMAKTEHPVTMIVYFGVVTSLVSLPPALTVWRWPTAEEYLLLGLVGALGSLGQSLAIRALEAGEATAVTPFEYARMPIAILMGWLLFDSLPDHWTFIGAALVIGSTLYIARREARLGKRPPPAAPT